MASASQSVGSSSAGATPTNAAMSDAPAAAGQPLRMASPSAFSLGPLAQEAQIPSHQHQRHHTTPTVQPHHLLTHLPLALRSASSTPMHSPLLFSPSARHQPPTSISDNNTPVNVGSPYLHPLQQHKVLETHKANIDSDTITGRKIINQYEVIEEIGRGVHGKVKLARNLQTNDNVAIKIIPRYSKKRRLGKVTALPQEEKNKKEIAILKKIRHPNVVALLEVIDDLDLKKIYMVLEHVELGEVVWRKKGLPHICQYERRRIEREMRGDLPSADEQKYDKLLEQRQALKELKRAKMAQQYAGPLDYWSVEHGAADENSSGGRQSRIPSREDFAVLDQFSSRSGSRAGSRVPSRAQSLVSLAPAPSELDEEVDWDDDLETPGPRRWQASSSGPLEGGHSLPHAEEAFFRGRSPSMADSIISHMSSVDYNHHSHDAFADDFSYVPCFTLDEAKNTFRDTVLGLEYLHYQGVVHRDIKPANLLWTKDHRVKISDFGVSYFGRPTREGEPDDPVSESEARDFDDDLELAKTVGTPAFFAPELCYTDPDKEQPKISEQIDVWSLGVTLYCLIFARIPFLGEDEFQMFRKIASEDVYIPRRRLKPVHPSTSPNATSLYKRVNGAGYRDDNSLEYEDIDKLLLDLLRLMLIKNPEKRIRLRDIKRHPWVVAGIQNPIGWLDDTDSARLSSGRKIQVDESEMSSAVVPLKFLERVKKTLNKVIYPLVDRSESRSRRRAPSSANSSAAESLANHAPSTPQQRSDRRRSIRPDDYFQDVIGETPLAISSRTESPVYDPLATVLPPSSPRDQSRTRSAGNLQGHGQAIASANQLTERLQGMSMPNSPIRPSHTTGLSAPLIDEKSAATPSDEKESPRDSRAMESVLDDGIRARSVDRALSNLDRKAQPQVALSNATAPGSFQGRHTRAVKSVDMVIGDGILRSASVSPTQQPTFLHQRQLSADVNPRLRSFTHERPSRSDATPESFEEHVLNRKRILEATEKVVSPAHVERGPSPDQWPTHPGAPLRGNTMTTIQSSSTDSIDVLGTPLTSPSEVTSPVSGHPSKLFQSDPSLPGLVSNATSVSNDMESELLGRPGVVSNRPGLLETTDSLTPPAMSKEPDTFPLDQAFEQRPAVPHLDVYYENTRSRAQSLGAQPYHYEDDEDDDDSDDGLVMFGRSKKKSYTTTHLREPPVRRDTSNSMASTASNETAKKIPPPGDS